MSRGKAPVPLVMSDHALGRFLERAGGMDTQALKDQVATAVGAIAAWAGQSTGDDFTVVAGDLKFVVKAGVIVTVAPSRAGTRHGVH